MSIGRAFAYLDAVVFCYKSDAGIGGIGNGIINGYRLARIQVQT
ncbi:MAG: hypothetical protein PHQ43_13005 [Dehalococcoidales bacterium]|nr:hypothetical protein [Dehalococcoidales bacterium]